MSCRGQDCSCDSGDCVFDASEAAMNQQRKWVVMANGLAGWERRGPVFHSEAEARGYGRWFLQYSIQWRVEEL